MYTKKDKFHEKMEKYKNKHPFAITEIIHSFVSVTDIVKTVS